MSSVALLLKFVLENPQLVNQAMDQATRPGVVDTARFRSSFYDMSKEILNCYHPSARLRNTQLLGRNVREEWKFGADSSAVVRLTFDGAVVQGYTMVVGVYGKGNQVRTAVIGENAAIRYNSSCELENWMETEEPGDDASEAGNTSEL